MEALKLCPSKLNTTDEIVVASAALKPTVATKLTADPKFIAIAEAVGAVMATTGLVATTACLLKL
ncbi:hypothetical protein GCM10027317_49380 [Massilia agri]